LKIYDERIGVARRRYRSFVKNGLKQGYREDLIGGGLIRSAGGWPAVKEMKRAETFQKSDESILGDSDFVEHVLAKAREQMERKYAFQALGYTLEKLAEKASSLKGLEKDEIFNKGKERALVSARSLLCYWAVKDLGISMASLLRRFEISITGISLSVKRGEKIARKNNYELTTKKTLKL
jgi:putative transposase